MHQRKAFNPKRKIKDAPTTQAQMDSLADLARRVSYGGNPEHKRNPGDFRLTPPALPRRGKSLCDDAKITTVVRALALLRDGIEKGLVDYRWNGEGWPEMVWAVSQDGYPMEAQRERDGVYHGYPIPDADPLRAVVVDRWKVICQTL
jgi:hypothetical protein